MKVTVNGELREVAEGTDVRALLRLLSLPETAVAVEVNKRLIRSAKYDTILAEGDTVELVTFVGGG